jgi:predicted transcriptional regulator
MAEKTVREVMRAPVHTVSPDMTLAELDRAFIEKKVGGFPVVANSKILGLVTRSDVVRHLFVERSLAEMASGNPALLPDDANVTVAEIAQRVSKRIAEWTVKDLMVRDIVTFAPAQSIREAARAFMSKRIHRAPVVENGEIVGMLTSLDLVELLT